MAPTKQTRSAAPAVTSNASRSDTASWDASQDTTAAKMRMFEDMRKSRVKERRGECKEHILGQHQAQSRQLRESIEQCVQKHEQAVRAIRRPKVERLLEAIRKKQDLEAKIDRCQVELEQALLSASRQLQVALEGRMEDVAA